MITKGLVHIMGEISTSCYVDIEKIARGVILDVGYNDSSMGFDGNTCGIILSLNTQSPDISRGVNESLETKSGNGDLGDKLGAGDQGMVFGFACDETPELMPLPISLAHKLAKQLASVRKEKILEYLRPDGKTQVTVEYEDDIPKRIDTIVVSAQHSENVSLETIREDIIREVICPIIPEDMMDEETKIFVNPTGRFVVGGPASDSGLTGRKIIVDTYGGSARHGGGAFSGKDPSKVDRSAAYMARYIAKNIVASGICSRMEIQLSYAIGVAKPISINFSTFKTSKYKDEVIKDIIEKFFDCRPGAICEKFSLRTPSFKYGDLTNYGHFGRPDLDLPYEKLDMVDSIKEYLSKLN